MLSPSDSSLSLSLLAESRCEPCSWFGVRDPGVSAGWIWTTGIGVSRLASELDLSVLMVIVAWTFCCSRVVLSPEKERKLPVFESDVAV